MRRLVSAIPFVSVLSCVVSVAAVSALLALLPVIGTAQGTSYTGNGGKHTIQGRIFIVSGQRADIARLKIKLTSTNSPEMTVYADTNGTFAFKNLTGGSYYVIIDDNEEFEPINESVYIDDPGSSSVRGRTTAAAGARIINIPIHLQRRRAKPGTAPGIVNAKWTQIPKGAIEHYAQGLEFIRGGKVTEAENEFRQAIQAAPSFSPAHVEIGKIELKKGKLEAAAGSFRNAIRYDAEDFDAHLNLGIALLNLKKYDECEPELVTAAYINRTAVTPHFYLGIVFVMKKDLDIAQKAFETAKALNGGQSIPSIHRHLGGIYKAKRMDKEALKELETYLTLVPKALDADKVRKDISDLKSRQK